VSLERIKKEVALLDEQQQAELISYILQLRYAHDGGYHREVADRLNDSDKSRWLTPDEFEKRLDKY
jgi:hypothetical protein